MKKILFILLQFILTSYNFSQNLDSGLVAYFPFDGTLEDKSGKNNNISEILGQIGYLKGNNQKCVKFGGVNNPGHLKIKKNSTLDVESEMSISLWFRLDNSDGTDGYGNYVAINGGYCLIAKSGDANGYNVKVYYDGNNILSYGFANAYEWLKYNIELGGTITEYKLGVWKHIVFSIDKREIRCYVDGELNNKAKINSPSFSAANSQDLFLGKFSNQWYPLNGALDDVRIYNRALSKIEVQRLYKYVHPDSIKKINLSSSNVLEAARAQFSKENFSSVLELLKDFPTDDALYFDAIALMRQALAKLNSNSSQNFVTVSGNVQCGCNIAISGYIVFEDLISKATIGRCRIAPDGYYCIVLPSGKKYSYYIDSKDFYPSSRVVDFSIAKQNPNHIDNINIVSYEEMKEKQLSIRINNIFFDFNESKLKPESYPELNRLYNYLSENSDIKVEISGHTDNIGTDEYNINLSNARAKTVKEYLVEKGISSSRIVSNGYGKSNPVATNATDEGRQLNRRVEFKIMK